MTEIEAFKTTVEAYIADKQITPTRFGKDFAGDPLFVFQLREGREPRTSTRTRVLDAISSAGFRLPKPAKSKRAVREAAE